MHAMVDDCAGDRQIAGCGLGHTPFTQARRNNRPSPATISSAAKPATALTNNLSTCHKAFFGRIRLSHRVSAVAIWKRASSISTIAFDPGSIAR
jgi:hypothetical protein